MPRRIVNLNKPDRVQVTATEKARFADFLTDFITHIQDDDLAETLELAMLAFINADLQPATEISRQENAGEDDGPGDGEVEEYDEDTPTTPPGAGGVTTDLLADTLRDERTRDYITPEMVERYRRYMTATQQDREALSEATQAEEMIAERIDRQRYRNREIHREIINPLTGRRSR